MSFNETIAHMNDVAMDTIMDEICRISEMFVQLLETGDGFEQEHIVVQIEQRMAQVNDDLADFRPLLSADQHQMLSAMAQANGDSLAEMTEMGF